MSLRRISTPLTLDQKLGVVTVDQVKAQARITTADEDDLIKEDIEAAYDFLSGPEGWLRGYCLLEEEFEVFSGRILTDTFELPLRPLSGEALSSFEVLSGEAYVPVSASVYGVDVGSTFPSIYRAGSLLWPYTGRERRGVYRIRFKVGFDDPALIPSPIKKAIKMLCAYWYAQRETVGTEGRSVGEEVLYGLQNLCGRYRVAHNHS